MSRPVLLLHCQHSLGLGHLARALALADALSKHFRVVLASGGRMPDGVAVPEGVELVLLSPLSMGTDGVLVNPQDDRPVEAVQDARREQLLRLHDEVRPDVVLVELFPFGRRRFKSELLPLLEAARAAGATIACSLRDILVASRRDQAAHDEQAVTIANAFFDAVLVHADPRFARLEESLHAHTPLRVPVHHTGFVAPRSDRPAAPAQRERRVVVSAGGGAYGADLLRAAVEGHRLALAPQGVATTLLTGPFLAPAVADELQAAARELSGLEVRRQVPDLCAELATVAGSVSQCGYNTALDLIRSRVPALVVPFAEGREDEQTRRAERLERLGLLRMLPAAELSGEAMARALRALLDWRPADARLDLDGGAASARLLAGLAARRTAEAAA